MTNEQKQEYNTFLENLNKAKAWLDNPKVSLEKREAFIPRVQELMRDMERIRKSFNLTNTEMMEGFRL